MILEDVELDCEEVLILDGAELLLDGEELVLVLVWVELDWEVLGLIELLLD